MKLQNTSTTLTMGKHHSWTSHLTTSTVVNLATLGPIGRSKIAPGTLGSLAGLIFYLIVFFDMHPMPYLMGTVAMILLAIAICGEAELRLNKKDPSEVVLDEFAVMPVCFIGLEDEMQKYSMLLVLALAFALYRFFDIKKPSFIYKLQSLRGGWGVVVDDLAAAFATNLVLHALFFGIDFVSK